MKVFGTLLFAIFLASSAWAQSFPIEVKTDFGERELEYSTHASGQTAIVSVVNKTDHTVSCVGTFKNGPETVRSKKSTIKSKGEGKLFFTAQRNIIKVRVDLKCTPVK